MSIKHSGDDLTGKGSGDDETIWIQLNKINPIVDSIWPIVTVYTHNK